MPLTSEMTTTFEIKSVPFKASQKTTEDLTAETFQKLFVFTKDDFDNKPIKFPDYLVDGQRSRTLTFLSFSASAYEFTDCEKKQGFTLKLDKAEGATAGKVQPKGEIIYAAKSSFPLPEFAKLTISINPKMFAKPDDEVTATVTFGVSEWREK